MPSLSSTTIFVGVGVLGAAAAGLALFAYIRQRGYDVDGSPKSPTADALNAAKVKGTAASSSAFAERGAAATGGGATSAAAAAKKKKSGEKAAGGFSEKAKSGRIHVVYGSATGTAESYARAFAQDTAERACPAVLWDAEEFYEEYFTSATATIAPSAAASSYPDDPFQVVVFVVATTGDGEPTDNFRRIFDLITRTMKSAEEMDAFHTAAVFKQRAFAVFGLGDTSYKYYNKVAVDLDAWLATSFHVKRLTPCGLGDAKDPNQEDVFDSWKELVWDSLDAQCGIALSEASAVPRALELVFVMDDPSALQQPPPSPGADLSVPPTPSSNAPSTGVSPTTWLPPAAIGALPAADTAMAVYTAPPSHLEPSMKHPLMAKVLQKRELLTASAARTAAELVQDTRDRSTGGRGGLFEATRPSFADSTILLEISIEGSGIVYQGGDHCAIFPTNPDRIVDGYLAALRIATADDAARKVKLCTRVNAKARASLQNTLPGHVSLRLALAHYFDLCGRVRKSTLRQLARFCTDPTERRVFNALIQSMSGKKLPATTAADDSAIVVPPVENFRIVLDFLRYFPSCEVPLAHFFELMPKMQPRYYSIASDQLTHKSTIQLIIKMERGGLTSEYLTHAVSVGAGIPIFVRKSNFHLPLSAKQRPIVMIGPGTGVAPLIGFLNRRRGWLAKKFPLGEAMLFFGCRRRDEDDIAAEFIASFLQSGELTFSQTAYSREQDDKVYVQNLLAANSAHVAELLLKRDGAVYICGDASRMAKDVERALLEEVLTKAGGLSKHVAGAVLKKMEKSERFLKDVW